MKDCWYILYVTWHTIWDRYISDVIYNIKIWNLPISNNQHVLLTCTKFNVYMILKSCRLVQSPKMYEGAL